jgi:hypothetical protein
MPIFLCPDAIARFNAARILAGENFPIQGAEFPESAMLRRIQA